MTGRFASSALPTEVWVLGKAWGEGTEAIRNVGGRPMGELATAGSNLPIDPGQALETPDRVDEQVAPPNDAQGMEENLDKLIENGQGRRSAGTASSPPGSF